MAPATALGAARSSFVASAVASLGAGRRAPRAARASRGGARSPETRHRGPVRVRAAGAFIKLIEIPAARGIAKALMIPARRFMDGASGEENVLSSVAVRVPNEPPCVPFETAPLLPLSGYDVGEVPFVMQAVCYYEKTLDVEALVNALAQTLSSYPLLAGRLDLADPNRERKGVRLTNDGAPLRCVTTTLTFADLPDDYADASRRFLDYEPWIDIMLGGAPVFTAKVTQLKGGGSALGVCMSHAVSDGQGFIEFLVAWAERANGRDHPMGPPVFDRALLPSPPTMGTDAMTEMLRSEGFDSVDPTLMLGRALVAGRVLVPDFLRFPPGNRLMIPVSSENLKRIVARAGEGASQNEALSAHVWLELSKLLGPEGGGFLSEGTVLEHVTVVTARGGKRGLPDMYFGNASVGVCTGRLAIGDKNLRTVKQVRDAIKPGLTRALMRRGKFLMLTEATFRVGVSAFDFDINRFMEGNMVWCNNLTDIYLKLYRLDFGTGAPKLALPPELNDIVQIQCSRPAGGAAAGENGVEMFVNLPPKVMQKLRTPQAIARLAGDEA